MFALSRWRERPTAETYDVFISYRRETSASQARLIRSELEKRGYRVFLDVADLDRGYFDQALLKTIAETPNFILVLAPGSLDNCVNENDWLRREVRHAIETKRNIVPVTLPGFAFPAVLPPDIAEVPLHQAVEYSHTLFDATLDKLLKAIGKPGAVPKRIRFAVVGAAAAVALALATYAIATYVSNSPRDKIVASVVPLVDSDKATIVPIGQPQPALGGDTVNRPETSASNPPGEPDPALYSISYHDQRTRNGYDIDYRLPYLDLLRAGGPVAGVRYETSPFLSTFPRIRATIANNKAVQIVVTAVVMDIKKSDVRNEVVLTVDYGSTNTIVLINHGWAEVEDATLTFSMTGADAGRATTPAAAPNALSLGTFGASKIVPIVKYVPRELTDAALADIAGEIQYGAAGQRQTVKFTTTVRLQTRYGKPLPPTEAYDLFFKSGETGHIVADLPCAHQIKPGEAEAFDLRISTDRSSTTTMDLSFLTAEGDEIPANTLTFNLFVPRFTGMQLRQRANGSKGSCLDRQ